jgi:hypothetical protein
MARQSRGRSSAPARRPTVPSAPRSSQQQTRPASTAAYPPSAARPQNATAGKPQQAGSQGPGLFGQMASTAA